MVRFNDLERGADIGEEGSDWVRLAKTLDEHGFALTPQRRVIFSELSRTLQHPTAEEIHARLRRRNPELSLATVYKSLQLFIRIGLARAVPTPDGRSRFEAAGEANHHHLRCVYCGAIEDLEDARIELKLPHDVGEQTGYTVLDAEVQLSGVCRSCRDRMESASEAPLWQAVPPPRRKR